jgi:hypothetical protein
MTSTRNIKISADELDYIANIFIQYCSNQMNKSEMLDYFPINPNKKDCVFKAIEARKLEVCKYLMNEHNSRNIPLMKSFDWDIQFIVGNSSLSSYREQLATLSFECQKGNNTETISMELDKNTLESVIKKLENCIGVNE